MYSAGVMNKITGKIDEVHLSFQNMSHSEQQEMIELVDSLDVESDPSQYEGMSEEEIALSHEYMDEADDIDMTLGMGATVHFDHSKNNEAELNKEYMEDDLSFMNSVDESQLEIDATDDLSRMESNQSDEQDYHDLIGRDSSLSESEEDSENRISSDEEEGISF